MAIGAFLLPVLYLPTLSWSADAPKAAVLWVMTAAGLPLLVSLAWTRSADPNSRNRVRAARAGLAFVVVALAATLTSATPAIAVVGAYTTMTGLIFLVGLMACWALGTMLTAADRRLLETAIVASAALNAAVALLQRFPGLDALGLPLYGGAQPDGLLGNPVFLGALLAAAIALLFERVERRTAVWGPIAVLIGFGIGISGQRLPVLVAIAVVAWSLWVVHRTSDGFGDPRNRSAAIRFGGLVIVPMAIGALLPGPGTLITHVSNYGSAETFGDRLGAWSAGLHALASHPLFGYGPDQFQAATISHYSLAAASQLGGVPFYDAHNIVIELGVAIGLLGLIATAIWAWFALRDRTGPLVVFALGLLAYTLVEPLFVSLVPLAFLAIGAAERRDRPIGSTAPVATGSPGRDRTGKDGKTPHWARRFAAGFAVVALLPALALVVGDIVQQRAATLPEPSRASSAAADATTAHDLLLPWPDPLVTGALATYASGAPGHSEAAHAVRLAQAAIARDRTNSQLWTAVIPYQVAAGDTAGARASAVHALQLNPWSTAALNSLGELAAISHDAAQARSDFMRSLAIDPAQTTIRQFVDGTCRPIATTAFGGPSIGESCTPLK